jgi:hypothetical protein
MKMLQIREEVGFTKGRIIVRGKLVTRGNAKRARRRIVAKVDELTALCDRLEASLATADDTRGRLLEALLTEALAPDEERELEAAE